MNKILRNKNKMDRPSQFELMFVENLDESSNNSTSSNKSSILTFSTATESVSTTSTTSSTLYTLANDFTENKHQQVQESKVVVPSWRLSLKYKPFYRIEGTESLTDDTFLKRHQKYENEEIKIKRWDMRRQREEYERNKLLKGRQSTSKVQPSVKLNEPLAQGGKTKAKKNHVPDLDSGIVCKQFDIANLDGMRFF